MKKVVIIGAIIMGIAAIFYCFSTSKNDNKEKQCNNTKKKKSIKRVILNDVENVEDKKDVEINLSSPKQDVVDTIRARHEDAAQIIKESLEHIYEESEDTAEVEESEADEINARLDELIE